MTLTPFQPWLTLWKLLPDGVALHTRSSDLLPVRWRRRPAMLKLARSGEERRGAGLMAYWQGEGAARIFAVSEDGAALLMEKLDGPQSLTALAQHGQDDEASRIVCAAAAELHRLRSKSLPPLLPLEAWFRALFESQDSRLALAAATARELLDAPQDLVTLHGDIHHGNVLDGGERGWLAIDPKGLWGERAYDYANIFCNPDLTLALAPGRLERQLGVVAGAANLAPLRLARWILAYTGLSAAWWLEDGAEAQAARMLAVGERAQQLLE